MGIRDAMSNRRGLTATVAFVCIAVALGAIVVQVRPSTGLGGSKEKMFLTVDDGKSFIVDELRQDPPVQIEGKTAYRAYLFTCDGDKTRFVGYLERFTPAGKRLLEQSRQQKTMRLDRPKLVPGLARETEIKRPGDTEWVKESDTQRATKIMEVHCPTDPNRLAELVHE